MEKPHPRATLDLSALDAQAWLEEFGRIRQEALSAVGAEDLKHLRRYELRSRLATLGGITGAAFGFGPLAGLAIAYGNISRWILAHHVIHGAYANIPACPDRFKPKTFGAGARRMWDWNEWFPPDAWLMTHNLTHHRSVGEPRDSDLVENHMAWLRTARVPLPFKWIAMLLVMTTWKFLAYSLQLLNTVELRERENVGHARKQRMSLTRILSIRHPLVRKLWLRSYLPYLALNFVGPYVLIAAFSKKAAIGYLLTRTLAEAFANVWAFAVIWPNHCADDLYRFEGAPTHEHERLLRQIIGTANFSTGSEWLDSSQVYMNYHIEHHLIPSLTMLGYRRIQPKIKAFCQKFGVPYRQEMIHLRLARALQVCTGMTRMLSERQIQWPAAPGESLTPAPMV